MLDIYNERRFLIPFRSGLLPHIFTDVLVIGAGVAGLRAALAVTDAADNADIIVLSKDKLSISNTARAQGGIAVAGSTEPTKTSHYEDTIRAGADLCEPDAVRTLVDDSASCIDELMQWGMRFDRDTDGELDYGREGGHQVNRILHSDGAATGRELARCLSQHVTQHPRIRVFEHCFSLDLLTPSSNESTNNQRVLGALTHHPRYGLQIIWANVTILACGGCGQAYRESTNAPDASGDGIALAWRAGAELTDLEFMQFHPTTLYVAGASRMLITEAVRGEGAHLVDRDGRRFVFDYHEMGELAPRDIVSRAIIEQLAKQPAEPGAAVYLDARHIDRAHFVRRFPDLIDRLRDFAIDPAYDLIPVRPAAHYHIGGVRTDTDGRTSLPGLYACGECACNGLHGANRLASNSLLEGLVFGRRAGRAAARDTNGHASPTTIVSDITVHERGELDLADVRSSVRSAMWRNVGIERSGAKLNDVLDMFDFWARYTLTAVFDDPAGWSTQNLLTVGALIARAAAWREESRGVHWRRDFPLAAPHFAVHAVWWTTCNEPRLLPVGELETIHA